MKKASKILVFSSVILTAMISLISFKEINSIEGIGISKIHKLEDQKIEGTYVLKSCENSRFKIKIEKKAGVYSFLIFDKKKIISKGKVKKQKIDDVVYLSFGKMEGVYDVNKIQIQNYGNSMNEYTHFTQCEEKYLSFTKTE